MFPREPEKIKQPPLVEPDVAADSTQSTLNTSMPEQPAFGGSDPYIGKIIGGHFQILSRIGSGGMSVVYLGKHLLLDKIVAIKLISAQRLTDGNALVRFQQEAKAASSLNHRNIALVSEFGQDEDGSPFLVMEYAKGRPLSQVLKEEGKLTLERAVRIMDQLCAALEHAHQQSVVHRDIKPANIILTTGADGNETVKIVDFGIAKLLSQDGTNLTQTGEVFGTPNYMSPEQCLGKVVDRRADLYALGCLFDELLTGTATFASASALETLMLHVNKTPAGRHSPQLNEIILRALEKDPSDRFQSAKEMSQALQNLGQAQVSIFQTSVPSKRRVAAGLLVGGLVTFALLAAAIFLICTAKTEIQKFGIAMALILFIGGMLNIFISLQLKKQPGQTSLKDVFESMTNKQIEKK